MYELIIIGGGPAGCAAGVYAARKQIKTALIAYEFGGQSNVSDDIQNWIGTPHISGAELAKTLEAHVREYAGEFVEILKAKKVANIIKNEDGTFTVNLETGEQVNAKAVLITAGSNRRKLDAKNADMFEHKGLTYCASCDGPFFTDMPVAVIGGGNAGLESALQLSAYCSKVYILNRSDKFRADEITLETVRKNPKIEIIPNAISVEVLGDEDNVFVGGLIYKNTVTNEDVKLDVKGIFIEIGQLPNTGIARDLVKLDTHNKIIIDHKTMKTSQAGIWAAGDCTDVLYHQNNIAAGDAVKALEDIYQWLQTQK
ncbi:MAG: FAD-dependent oxidoreductase [Candidatus Pacebacteria bacterium]|nr:FAD-dependent oxidoreductase [Candidatus Paceibacterota bacterium]